MTDPHVPYRIVIPRPPFRTPMSLDGPNLGLTLVVFVFVGAVIAGVLATGSSIGVGTVAFVGAVLGLSWAMSPRALSVHAGELLVERRAWPALRVPLSSIVRAQPFDRHGAVRVFGVGGFCGSYGLFANEALGRFRMYSTRGGQAVLVRRAGDELPIVVTPDDVAGTIEAIDPRPPAGLPAASTA
jgi:hypothetical protein